MKLFLSADIEGTAGVAHWDETEKGHPGYEHFARQMSLEVAAACEGAVKAGYDEILVRDAHDLSLIHISTRRQSWLIWNRP